MEITKNKTENLITEISIKIQESDYSENLKKEIENIRKKANFPGFRPGKAPLSFVEKQYKYTVLADVLDKLVSKNINEYFKDNKIELLGEILPLEKNIPDFKTDKEFNFYFEYAEKPEVNTDKILDKEYDCFKISISEKEIDEKIDQYRRNFGKVDKVELSQTNDYLFINLKEILNEGEEKETIIDGSYNLLLNDKVKAIKHFIDKKNDDIFNLNIKDIYQNDEELANLLRIKPQEINTLSENFEVKINSIYRIELAEMNEDFFKKVFVKEDNIDENIFREKIKGLIENLNTNDSNRQLVSVLYDTLLNETEIELPEEFILRWLKYINDYKFSDEQIKDEYEKYAKKELKWDLIKNSIIKQKNIELHPEQFKDFVKGSIHQNYLNYGMQFQITEQILESETNKALKDKNQFQKFWNDYENEILMRYLVENVKRKEVETSYEEFMDKIENK